MPESETKGPALDQKETPNRPKGVISGIIGFALIYLLTVIAPIVTAPVYLLVKTLHIGMPSFHFMGAIVMLIIGVILPIIVSKKIKNRWPPFSTGMLIGALTIGLLSFLFTLSMAWFAQP